MTEKEGTKEKQGYDRSYEGGFCPYGYRWVEGHYRDGVWVPGFCRKIKKHRFFSEDW
jgi:hypothetical protein